MLKTLLAAPFLVLVLAVPAFAHFGVVVPDRNIVTGSGPRTVNLDIRFWHPMEGQGMTLEKPGMEVIADGKKQDLSAALVETATAGKKTWKLAYEVKRPGVLVFAMTPPPYWEPAENKFIVHLTKTVVGALGDDEGWDKPAGLKMEIVPMVKPFALYAGNVFTGKVLKDGKPLANAEVEVEFFNKDGAVKAPDETYATQVVKTDGSGVFSYAAPWAGWWGFAALADGGKMKKDGKDRPVELGGVIWVYFHAVPGAKGGQ